MLVRRLLALSIRVHFFAGLHCESAFALNKKEQVLHEHYYGQLFPPSTLLQVQDHHLLACCTNKKRFTRSSFFFFVLVVLVLPLSKTKRDWEKEAYKTYQQTFTHQLLQHLWFSVQPDEMNSITQMNSTYLETWFASFLRGQHTTLYCYQACPARFQWQWVHVLHHFLLLAIINGHCKHNNQVLSFIH